MAEFIVGRIKLGPPLMRREIGRHSGKTLLKRLDQAFLPGLALNLPSTKPDEGYEGQKRERGWNRKAGARAPGRRNLHGASPPVKRPSSALLWYCSAIRSPLTGRNGKTAVIKISGPHSSACTQYGGA